MSSTTLTAIVLFTVAPAVIGYHIGKGKKRGDQFGLALGLVFSWLGVVVLCFMPDKPMPSSQSTD
jgi:phosphatidylserine synthase